MKRSRISTQIITDTQASELRLRIVSDETLVDGCSVPAYWTSKPDTLEARHGQARDTTQNGVRYAEGQLIIATSLLPSPVDFYLTPRGELVVVGQDAHKYSLSPDGNLIYDFCAGTGTATDYVADEYVDDDYVD